MNAAKPKHRHLYNIRDLDQLLNIHTPEAIRQRLEKGPHHNYLKDFIYGAIDGAVTTFAVVSGVAGAKLSASIVIILGVANLIGDGFSMAIGNFLGTRAEAQLRDQMREIEAIHIEKVPDGEREEIRQIFAAKGFEGEDLERIVKVITANPKLWVDTMLQEEMGLPLEGSNPLRAAVSTFSAFLLVGALPLIPFILKLFVPELAFNAFLWSSLMTGAAFFAVGTFKSRFVAQPWFWSGAETFVVGSCAAILAYGVGVLLSGIAGTGV